MSLPKKIRFIHSCDGDRLTSTPAEVFEPEAGLHAAEDAERQNLVDGCRAQRVGRMADDPTYCCDHGEEITALIGWIRELEARVADLAAKVERNAQIVGLR